MPILQPYKVYDAKLDLNSHPMIRWTYRFLYQSILILFSKGWKQPHSEWNAIVIMPVPLLLLLMTLLDALDVFPAAESYLDAAEAILSVYMCLIMLNYFLFIHNHSYQDLLVDYVSKGSVYRGVSMACGVLLGIGGIVFPMLYLLLNL